MVVRHEKEEFMSVEIRSAIDFYERHPISSEFILAKLNASRGHLNDVAPEELFHMTRIIMEVWKLMTHSLHVQVSAKPLASLIFVRVWAGRHVTWLTAMVPMSPALN
jgi:hypothetical protein